MSADLTILDDATMPACRVVLNEHGEPCFDVAAPGDTRLLVPCDDANPRLHVAWMLTWKDQAKRAVDVYNAVEASLRRVLPLHTAGQKSKGLVVDRVGVAKLAETRAWHADQTHAVLVEAGADKTSSVPDDAADKYVPRAPVTVLPLLVDSVSGLIVLIERGGEDAARAARILRDTLASAHRLSPRKADGRGLNALLDLLEKRGDPYAARLAECRTVTEKVDVKRADA